MRYLVAIFLLWAGAAVAQPTCSPTAPGAIACLSVATSPALTDIVWAQQTTGPLRANQTVSMSLQQILTKYLNTPNTWVSPQTFSGSITAPSYNATGANGYQLNGSTILNIIGTTSSSTLLGRNAGAALNPSTGTFATFIGDSSGALYNSNAEITGLGNGSCAHLVSPATADTCVGVFAMYYATNDSNITAFGGDAARNTFGVNSNVWFGNQVGADWFGKQSVGMGTYAMRGNSASILIGGSPTTGDTIPLTFTSAAYAGGFKSITYTVKSSDTTLAILAASIAAAIQANAPITAIDLFAVNDFLASPNVVAIQYPGTGALGITLTVTAGAITGAATETVTITNGGGSNDNNIGIGYEALLGYRVTTAYYNLGIGRYSLANLTSGIANNCGGDESCMNMTTANFNTIWGAESFMLATTANNNAGLGYNVGADCTTCREITLIGANAGTSGIAANNDVIILTDGSACNTSGVNTMIVCGSGGQWLSVTGTNTVSATTAQFFGSSWTLGKSGTNAGTLVFANATSGTITLSPPSGALGTPTLTLPTTTGTLALAPLSATSASLGGGALIAGACATTATTVTGATVGMAVVATPNTYPGAGNIWNAYVSAANTVTTEICAIIAATPTASTYNIRVLQ